MTDPNPELDDDEFTDAALRAAVWAVLVIDALATLAVVAMVAGTVASIAWWAA